MSDILYICVAVKSTAWIAFKNTYLADFNTGRGNAPDFESLMYTTKENGSGDVFNFFTFQQRLMQHGVDLWNGAYMTGMQNAFNNPAGRMIAAGDVANVGQWLIDNGLFENIEPTGE